MNASERIKIAVIENLGQQVAEVNYKNKKGRVLAVNLPPVPSHEISEESHYFILWYNNDGNLTGMTAVTTLDALTCYAYPDRFLN